MKLINKINETNYLPLNSMDPSNIQEYVVRKVIDYVYEHDKKYEKLEKKYNELKKITKIVICKQCKQYSRNTMGKSCGHRQCHPCWLAENSLIFIDENESLCMDRNDCLRCWLKNRSLADLKNIVSIEQQNHNKEYFSYFELK